jgi:uncharacterized protein
MAASPHSDVILLVGLPGVGKTTLADALARQIDGQILSRDRIRDAIFPEIYLDYSPEQNSVGTDTLYAVLEYILAHRADGYLIIDGKPFSRAHEVSSVLALADKYEAKVHVLHCDAPLEIVQERLARGLSDIVNQRADRTPEKAERILAEFEPLGVPHLKLDMTRALASLTEEVANYIGYDSADRAQ